MRLNLKMWQWGIALVSVLLAVELCILGALGFLLHKTEQEAAEYEHAMNVVSTANYLLKIFYDSAICLIYYMMTHKSELSTKYDQSMARLPVQIEKLHTLTSQDPTQFKKVEKLCTAMDSGSKYLTEYKTELDKDEMPNLKDLKKHVLPIMTDIMGELKEFVAQQDEDASRANAAEKGIAMRLWMFRIVVAGIVLNVLLAVGLILAFSKVVTKKLDVLRDNALRLASNAPLNPVLTGKDEIAQVDQMFHEMADMLKDTAEKEKEATEAIKASEERVRTIIEHMPVGLIAINSSGIIESINPRTEQIFDCSQRELVGDHISILFEDSENGGPDQFMQLLTQKARDRIAEFTARKKDKITFPAEISLREFATQRGPRFLVNVLDVSERHEVERLKQEFVSIVSHDLRTPLASVHGSLTLLSAGAMGELSKGAREVVETAETEIERLTRLVNDLLDVAKMEAGKMDMDFKDISLGPVIKRSLAAVGNFAERHGVTIVAQETSVRTLADSERLIQVLVNLLSNAIKFSKKGDKVEVTVVELPEWVEVRVKDEGRGVPETHIEAIFQRFKQVARSDATEKGGTGLGLPICKTIIEQHGGTIGVESEINKGSTFWFRLRPGTMPASL